MTKQIKAIFEALTNCPGPVTKREYKLVQLTNTECLMHSETGRPTSTEVRIVPAR